MGKSIDKFKEDRERLNKLILSTKDKHLQRFFALDNSVYGEGVLPVKIKELLGLVASMVLRCNDCISYHVDRCFAEGLTRAEFDEAMGIALVVGGSICIPHVRVAYDIWDELEKDKADKTV